MVDSYLRKGEHEIEYLSFIIKGGARKFVQHKIGDFINLMFLKGVQQKV